MSDASNETRRLIDIMAALRDPKTGCPWDIEQDFASIAPYTIEEAYEVADAIEREDWPTLTAYYERLSQRPAFRTTWADPRVP